MTLTLSRLLVILALGVVPLGAWADSARERLARGEYLARAGNCLGCHTREGGHAYSGGVAFDTPYGTLYSTNLTPDLDHGLGGWTDAEFLRAMWYGTGRRGEHLYPAFPYTAYTQLSADDVLAIKAYLDSLAPVAYQPPANRMDFPYGNRALLGAWKWLHFEPGRFEPAVYASAEIARGAYLSEALGHCGECHTPRTLTQGLDRDRHYAGAVAQGWAAWNITPSPRGIGDWSDEKLLNYLRNGHQRGEAVAGGPMAAIVSQSLRHLSEPDLQAMVAYLRSLPPQTGEVPAREEIEVGDPPGDSDPAQVLLVAACESCHYRDNRAPGGPYPESFPHYSAVRDPSGRNLIGVLLQGLDRHGKDQAFFMPAYRDLLDDEQIAALASYIGRRFGGHAGDFSAADVARLREELQ